MPLLERFQRSRPTSQKYQECRRKVCISHLDIINLYINLYIHNQPRKLGMLGENIQNMFEVSFRACWRPTSQVLRWVPKVRRFQNSKQLSCSCIWITTEATSCWKFGRSCPFLLCNRRLWRDRFEIQAMHNSLDARVIQSFMQTCTLSIFNTE